MAEAPSKHFNAHSTPHNILISPPLSARMVMKQPDYGGNAAAERRDGGRCAGMDGTVKIIACKTIEDEIERVRGDIEADYCEGFLHDTPDKLRATLNERIAATPEDCTILLGYGRCSNGTMDLETGPRRVIMPACDDCIAMLLGSRRVYLEQFAAHPGTFYYTRGWMEELDDPYREYLKLVPKLGEETAREACLMYMEGYSRVAIIDTGTYDMDRCESYVQKVSEFFGLPVHRLQGSLRLLEKLVRGPHDDEFLDVQPGDALVERLFWDLDGREPAPETEPNPPGTGCADCVLACRT